MSERELFNGVLNRRPVDGIVGSQAWLRALLDAEAALATAGAQVGLVPAAGNPLVPLVLLLEEAAGPEPGQHMTTRESRRTPRDVLADREPAGTSLSDEQLDRLLDPTQHLGHARALVDRALAPRTEVLR